MRERMTRIMGTGAWLTVDELSILVRVPRELIIDELKTLNRSARKRGTGQFCVWEYRLESN